MAAGRLLMARRMSWSWLIGHGHGFDRWSTFAIFFPRHFRHNGYRRPSPQFLPAIFSGEGVLAGEQLVPSHAYRDNNMHSSSNDNLHQPHFNFFRIRFPTATSSMNSIICIGLRILPTSRTTYTPTIECPPLLRFTCRLAPIISTTSMRLPLLPPSLAPPLPQPTRMLR